MLNSEVNRIRSESGVERRERVRGPGPVREIVLAWDHNLEQRVRFRLIDMSDTGLRIASALPILKDLAGVVISELCGSAPVNRPFVVAWSSAEAIAGEYHAGLRFLG